MPSTTKKAVSKQQRAAAVIIIAITFAIVYALTALSVMPVRYDIEAGDVAPATITASRDIEDKITTETARAEARKAVEPVYTKDESVTAAVIKQVSSYFDGAESAAEYLKDEYIDDRALVTGKTKEELAQNYDPASVKWNSFLTPNVTNYVKTVLGDTIMPDEAVYALAAMKPDELDDMESKVSASLTRSLAGGILEQQLQSEKANIETALAREYADEGKMYIAYLPVDKHLKPNRLYDAAATNAAMEAAAKKIAPVTYKQDQTVVRANDDVVTEAQLAVLRELGVVGGQEQDYMLYIGMFVFVALVFAAYAVYMFQFENDVVAETRKLVMLMAVTVVVVALAVPLVKLDSRIITAFFGTMLACVLVSQKSALALNVMLSFLVGAICSSGAGLMSPAMLSTMMITLLGGSAAVFSLYKPGYRASLIYSGLVAGGVGVAVSAFSDMLRSGASSGDVVVDSAFAVGSGLFGGVLAIGTLPIWEAMFSVSTPAKLIELSDPNHPLLKRLTVEAPGTYHHSILTANLAEAGADAVGANALLCRVGAYYHDVGKLKNPEYFKENQKNENPHDALDPRESAKIITEHLTYGMELARKYKLPRDIQKIMAQHHGDAIVPYFLHKAQEAGINSEDPVFRYRGTKPSSKESAVVMLADCAEAAVRSIDSPDREQVKDMITKIIRSKYNEGQFDDCPIGRRDLNALAKAFIGVYDGAFHERIKYPGQE